MCDVLTYKMKYYLIFSILRVYRFVMLVSFLFYSEIFKISKKKNKSEKKKHEQIECCFALRLIYFSLLLWYSNWRYDTISLCWLVSNIKRKKKTSNKNYSKQIYKVQTVKTTLTHSSCSCDMLYYLFWFLKCTIFFV